MSEANQVVAVDAVDYSKEILSYSDLPSFDEATKCTVFSDLEIVTAERDALQALLNISDQRVDELETLLRKVPTCLLYRKGYNQTAYGIERAIGAYPEVQP